MQHASKLILIACVEANWSVGLPWQQKIVAGKDTGNGLLFTTLNIICRLNKNCLFKVVLWSTFYQQTAKSGRRARQSVDQASAEESRHGRKSSSSGTSAPGEVSPEIYCHCHCTSIWYPSDTFTSPVSFIIPNHTGVSAPCACAKEEDDTVQ